MTTVKLQELSPTKNDGFNKFITDDSSTAGSTDKINQASEEQEQEDVNSPTTNITDIDMETSNLSNVEKTGNVNPPETTETVQENLDKEKKTINPSNNSIVKTTDKNEEDGGDEDSELSNVGQSPDKDIFTIDNFDATTNSIHNDVHASDNDNNDVTSPLSFIGTSTTESTHTVGTADNFPLLPIAETANKDNAKITLPVPITSTRTNNSLNASSADTTDSNTFFVKKQQNNTNTDVTGKIQVTDKKPSGNVETTTGNLSANIDSNQNENITTGILETCDTNIRTNNDNKHTTSAITFVSGNHSKESRDSISQFYLDGSDADTEKEDELIHYRDVPLLRDLAKDSSTGQEKEKKEDKEEEKEEEKKEEKEEERQEEKEEERQEEKEEERQEEKEEEKEEERQEEKEEERQEEKEEERQEERQEEKEQKNKDNSINANKSNSDKKEVHFEDNNLKNDNKIITEKQKDSNKKRNFQELNEDSGISKITNDKKFPQENVNENRSTTIINHRLQTNIAEESELKNKQKQAADSPTKKQKIISNGGEELSHNQEEKEEEKNMTNADDAEEEEQKENYGKGGDEEETEELRQEQELLRKERLELKRQNAYKDIIEIENSFATLRQKLYENKLAKLQMELQMCLDGSHPSLQQYLSQIHEIRDKKLQQIYLKQQYKLDCIDRETRASRYAIHQNFYKQANDGKESMLNNTTTEWYEINSERREMDVQIPDLKYHVPIKIANKSLSMITGYATQPAIPQLNYNDNDSRNSNANISEDMAAEGINWRFKNNPVDKLEVIVDRMRFNNAMSDIKGLRQYYGGFPGAPELNPLRETEILDDFEILKKSAAKRSSR